MADELNHSENDATINESGSLCPAVKATDMIGDKWTLLILRELLLGASRYTEFQRALPRISPTVLSKRLKQMEADGLLVKRSTAGEKSTAYRLTRCGRELTPLIEYLSKWGLRWARRRLHEEDLDVGAFMWDVHRSLITPELPDGETVFCIQFPEQGRQDRWWLVANGPVVDLCTDDPGKTVDLFMTGSLEKMAAVWMGDVDIQAAVKAGDIMLTGAGDLVRTAPQWFPKSRFADIRPRRFAGEPKSDIRRNNK